MAVSGLLVYEGLLDLDLDLAVSGLLVYEGLLDLAVSTG